MAGVGNVLFQGLEWKLTSLDDGSEIEGQFAPSNVRHDVSAEYTTTSTLGRSQPIIQYDGDTLEKIQFDATIRARHQGFFGVGADNIDELVERIKQLPRKSPDLGRSHVWLWTSGESLSLTCVVKSVGGVLYDRMRPLDGSFRSVTFRMELWRYVEYDIALTGSAAESLVRPFLSGESFESMGRRFYGDPSTGEALRRRNPAIVEPVAGDLLHLPPKNKLMRRFVRKPSTPVLGFASDSDARRVLNATLERHKTGRSHKLGVNWEGS